MPEGPPWIDFRDPWVRAELEQTSNGRRALARWEDAGAEKNPNHKRHLQRAAQRIARGVLRR